MPAAPPSAVLSESFQRVLEGRRVRTALFFTFSLDPAFFEQEILPVFLDIPLSQAVPVRLVQLEDELKRRLDHVAVYYDPRGLVTGGETPRLDVRRVPVAIKNGYFHPKNVFLLTESDDAATPGEATLIVATLSANLTKAGWWRNVECCHIEEVGNGAACGFRRDLLDFFGAVRRVCSDSIAHDALDRIHEFVIKRTRDSGDGHRVRLLGGRRDFVQFLSDATDRLKGLNLEVIAPYVDEGEAKPLQDLIDAFEPRECRVYLPRNDRGNVACSEAYYDTVRRLKPACWAHLPRQLLQTGPTQQAADRFVHAKVYRFFHPARRYEAVVVGSINLTSAAHGRGGNLESAFIVEPELNQVPDWWMSRADGKKPATFQEAGEDDVTTRSPAVWLSLTYWWDSQTAVAEWRGEDSSPLMSLESAGIPRLNLAPMRPGEHRTFADGDAVAIQNGLETTALFTVRVEGAEDGPLLVREEGMAWKPSILLTLSVSDILRYWSALTREQRLAVLEHAALRDPELASALTVARRFATVPRDSFFDNFAQIFQAFENVEQAVLQAIDAGRDAEAVQRLLGEKYDSLPCLLKRVIEPDGQIDALSRYLIALCARQTLQQVRKTRAEFARKYRSKFDELLRLTDTSDLRQALDLASVAQPEAFLAWFEEWFVRRAEPTGEPV